MSETLNVLQNATSSTISSTGSTGSIKEPQKRDLVGILLSAEEIESKGTSLILVSIQDIDDEVVTLSTSPGYWKKVGKLFPPDSIVKISYEARVAGKTGYKDASGNMIPHTSDGNNLVGITRFSSISYQRMLDDQSKSIDIAVISSVESDRVNAVAQYLSAYVKR